MRIISFRLSVLFAVVLCGAGLLQGDVMANDGRCLFSRVAEQYVAKHYPAFDTINNPPIVEDLGSSWKVAYELPPTTLGGTPILIIDKDTLEVTSAQHSQ